MRKIGVYLLFVILCLGCATIVMKEKRNYNGAIKKVSLRNSRVKKVKLEHLSKKDKLGDELVFSIEMNCGNSPSCIYDFEGEGIRPDTFFISENLLFIDDSFNNKILVYNDGEYYKEMNLEWYEDAKKIYFDRKKV